MSEKRNESGSYEHALEVANNTTKSIVQLMMRLGIREPAGKSERPLWESRKKLWNNAVSEIQKAEGDVSSKYQGTAKQNIALLKYVRNRIIGGEILDRKTLTFVPAAERKADVVDVAEEERQKIKEEILRKDLPQKDPPKPEKSRSTPSSDEFVGPPAPKVKKAPENGAVFENDKNVLGEISVALDRYLLENKNRPYDTSRNGADGYSRSEFRKKGSTQVLDNITGKLHNVSRDPSKADRVIDGFGREKLLTGEPAVCDDVITEFLNKNGIRISYERSVAILEPMFKARPKDFAVFKQGIECTGYGDGFKPNIACQVGDIMTTSRGSGRHIFLVKKVDGNGVPTEVIDSSAMNQGIGTRPFIGKNPTEDLTAPDFRGHPRARAVVGPGIKLHYVIRPKYKSSLRNYAKGDEKNPEV